MAIVPKRLLLTGAVVLALSACSGGQDAAAPAADAPQTAQAPAFHLDEASLPPYNRFLIDDLDTTKNACADFGGYVNGKWLAANPIPGDRSSWGAFEMLDERSTAVQHQLAQQAAEHSDATGIEKLVGDFWATGMDEAAIEAQGLAPLQDQLAAIDGLRDGASVAQWLRESAAKGQGFLWGIGAMPDFKDSSVNIAATGQGGLGLPDTTYYSAADKAGIREAYVAHIAKVLELSGVPADQAQAQAKDVMAFETRIAKVSKSREAFSRDVGLYYNPITVAEADKLTPNFPWTTFFESQGVAVPQTLSLSVPEFHQEVDRMLVDVPVEQWKAYLRFHVVDGASPYLSDAFVQQHFAFYDRTLGGQKEIEPRWKRVLGTVDSEIGHAMGQLYVQVAFPPESKAKMEALIANLSDALKQRTEHLEWMSPETKRKALAKWETFEPRVGYPDKWRDWSGLATSRESYLGNVLAATEFNYKWDLGKIGKPVDKSEWGMRPQTVNASYNPLANQLTFPAAILQPPFFDPEATDEINYGGIGAVIGHEMTHGYDDQGARFGPTGNMEDWWTPEDFAGFKARTGKLVQQFDDYRLPDGRALNGNHTLGENIADLGGLATAFDAMKKATAGTPDPMTDGMTRDQRFFLSWATVWRRNFTPEQLTQRLATDEHALSSFRAIGAPSNLPAFAAAFQCKPGDPMVRDGERQVVIW
ncbi:M13-type metalloendopeptidase [Luteimonas sp. FCS-9]|uniref:M13 family metallopeptidase n=1 Tax=Luteimonas sp. FCS-9 TaxID=1547516 RepID=UPI00063EAAB9|nr:M13-type metalloendopeptidase [Luteimonas sp. FCS-9]KLJ01787.1 peptidase [Luteimonas sp. FCS-9]